MGPPWASEGVRRPPWALQLLPLHFPHGWLQCNGGMVNMPQGSAKSSTRRVCPALEIGLSKDRALRPPLLRGYTGVFPIGCCFQHVA